MVRRSLALLAAAAIIVAACGSTASSAPGTNAPAATTAAPSAAAVLKKITVIAPNPSALVWYNLCVAMQEGYLADEGIQAEFQALDGSGAVLQAMAAGQAQIGIPGPGPVLAAWERGEKPVMFYDQYPQSLFGLVVPADSNIKSVADLKGKIIGTGTVDGAEVAFAQGILTDAGLKGGTADEVKSGAADYAFLPVGDGGPAFAAFGRGEIAAYSAGVSDMSIIEARGLALNEITPPKFLQFFGNSYTALQSTIDSDPEMIQGFTNALVKATAFAWANKAKTLADCAVLNPQEATDAALASALYDGQTSRSKPLGGALPGSFTLEAWKAWEDSLVKSGGLKAPVADLNAVFTNKFIEAAQAAQ